MIRILKNIFSILLVVTILVSCEEEDGRITFEGPYYVGFSSNTGLIGEAGETYTIQVNQVGPTLGSDITVNYTVEGTAQEGVDYTVVGGSEGTIVIPAGEHFGTLDIQTIDDLSADGALTLTLTLSANSAGLENGRGAIEKTLSLTITDDDCPLADGFAGTYTVVEAFTDGANAPFGLVDFFGEAYQVELTAKADDPSGTFFIINNSTGFDTYVADGTEVQFLTCSGELSFNGGAAAIECALFADLLFETTSYNEGEFSLSANGPLGGFGPYGFKFTKQ